MTVGGHTGRTPVVAVLLCGLLAGTAVRASPAPAPEAPDARAISRSVATEADGPRGQALKVEVVAGDADSERLLVFRGNILFSDYVYRSLLQLPGGARATRADADAVATRLRSFLRLAGYDLSTVATRVEGEQIVVEIDEGQLDKIVVFGSGIIETLRFRLELFLPAGIFDRLRLEQQLRDLARRYDLNRYSYELVPAAAGSSDGSLFKSMESLLGLPGYRPGQRYELHILVASNPWSRGLSPEVFMQGPEGLGVGGRFRSEGLAFSADRWEAVFRVAGNLRFDLDEPGSRVVFSRGLGEVRWLSPPLGTPTLRSALALRAEFLSQQRGDLGLENFDLVAVGPDLNLSWEPFPALLVAVAAGAERRFLFNLQHTTAEPDLGRPPGAQTRVYVATKVDMVANPGELRTDRRQHIGVEARWYLSTPSSAEAFWLRADYQQRILIGWHELRVDLAGAWLAGAVLFPDEQSIGDTLNGAFGEELFTRGLVGARLEFRFSVVRDAAKLGLFYGQVLYGEVERRSLDGTGVTLQPATAGAGGPCFNLLLADEFETGVYFAFGWTPSGRFSFSPSLYLRQVF